MSGTTSTGQFAAENGEITGPNGQPFVAKGVDLWYSDLTEANVTELTQLFRGINMVRIYDTGYNSPASYAILVNQLISEGIVVCIVDAQNYAGDAGGGGGAVFTGSDLTTELNWYTSMASYFKGNPYVWLGTNNEPSYTPSLAALSTWQQQTYNAIRAAGNNNIVMVDEPGGGNPGTMGPNNGLTASDYASMTNIVWDLHYYGWEPNYSTNQATVDSTLAGSAASGSGILGAESMPADGGTAPVIIGEFGDSTTGSTVGADWAQLVTAVETSGVGSTAWAWDSGDSGDINNLQVGGTLTDYGQDVAQYIAASAQSSGSTGSTTPPPASDPTILTPTSGGSVTDAAGDVWTLSSTGETVENGTPLASGTGTSELTAVNGVIWGRDAGTGDWYTYVSDNWVSQGSATPQASGSATPSANDTVIGNTTATIIDSAGNTWSITTGKHVAFNGNAIAGTENVIELAYINGTVWQENVSGDWWSWNGTAWTGGTSTSPLLAPTTTSPPTTTTSSLTILTPTTGGSVTDAAGDVWTLSSAGETVENGKPLASGSGTSELTAVSGVIWGHGAGTGDWYTYVSGNWVSQGSVTPQASGSTATTTPPATTSTSAALPNDLVVLAGSGTTITDASGNTWTITSGGQVAVNGVTDTTTANVTKLAYVNKEVWQENASNLWWGKTSPTASWSPSAGTSTSPLPAPVTIASGTASETITQSQISVVATAGSHMLFISGSNDIVNLTGGTDKITDTGSGNTYILPAAGHGSDTFTSDVLNNKGDMLDFKTALAATNWNGAASTLPDYLTVSNSSSGAVVSIAATSGGTSTIIVTITGSANLSLSTLLAHSIT